MGTAPDPHTTQTIPVLYKTREVTPQTVQFKNTTVGKTIRTFYQTCAGVLAAIIPVLSILSSNEDFRHLVSGTRYSWLVILIPVLIPIATAAATALQNGLDPTVPNTVKG